MYTWLKFGFLAAVIVGGLLVLETKVPCKQVIRYSLGAIDSRFNLPEAELLQALERSEEIWEAAAGRELFEYDPGGSFQVNLIFDERQERTLALAGIEKAGETTNQEQGKIANQYESLKAAYDKASQDYQEHMASYEERLNTYNRKVEMWNRQGGAPADEYEELGEEKEALDKEGAELEKERLAVNALVTRINSLAQREEQVVQTYNASVKDYEERYGPAQAFDQGEYVGSEINIYQFRDDAELRLVLAHEFGHALGLGHVENPESLMYYLMEKQDVDPVTLSAEDQRALASYCAHGFSLSPGSLQETLRFVVDRIQQYRTSYEVSP